MYKLRIKQYFDAAHYLKGYQGNCANLHGHRWLIEVVLWYRELNEIGMAIDFKEVKTFLKDILPDHKCLNEVYSFNPTAENLAKRFYDELRVQYGDHLIKIIIWENPDCSVEYTYGQTFNT